MTIAISKEYPRDNPYLNETDRPIDAICRLMRQLPDDITAAGPLTHDQSQMAEAVAFYTELTYQTAIDGLAEIGKLMRASGSACLDNISLGRLIQHLSVEAQCMQEASANYRDASMELCR
jgi:hypothetical protein